MSTNDVVNVDAKTGVNRFIIIGGRVHSYVDIEVDRTMLSGTNGAGKTSSVNVLQFLYVADEKRWSLGRSLTETKDFYFPPGNSTFAAVIFEVRTPTGVRLVIVRRPNGLLGELKYYVANGEYKRSDFLNHLGQARKWDELKLTLAQRGLCDITDHRQLCLTGRAVDTNLPNLGLVPLTTSLNGSYEKFATSFLNLLRLKDMNQDLLREILMDFAGIGESQRSVDLAKSLSDEIASIRRDANKIDRLGRFAAVVDEARATYERFLTAGKWLNAAYPAILEMRRTYELGFPLKLKAAEAAVAVAKQAAAQITNERREVNSLRTTLAVQDSEVKRQVSQLSQDEEHFADFDPLKEQAIIDDLVTRARELRGRIAKATDKSVEELERELSAQNSEVARITKDIESHSDLLVTWLRGRISAAQLNTLATLFSPDHLRAKIGPDVSVLSEESLLAEIHHVLAAAKGGKLTTEGIILKLDTSVGETAVKDLADVAALRNALGRATEKRNKTALLLEDAKQALQLEAEASRLDAGATTAKAHLAKFELMVKNRAELPKWQAALADLKVRIEALDVRLDELEARASTTGTALLQAQQQVGSLNNEKHSISLKVINNVKPVDPVLDNPEHDEKITEAELLPLIAAYERKHSGYTADKRAWDGIRANLEENLSDLYATGSTPRGMIKSLEEEVHALEKRREITNNRMQTALISAGREFKGLMDALNSLTKKVRAIQAAFSQAKISGIERVRCEVERNAGECERLQALINLDSSLNLFDDEQTVFDQFDRILHNRIYKLTDYFSVKLFIKPIGQPEKGYSEFTAHAGSTGQVVMLKTLFNFLIIRSYLKADMTVIPFFLDEAGTLDTKNFSVVVEFSRQMGFEGIYAAPLPSPVIHRYYTIAPNSDRLVVGAEQCQIITPKT